LRRIPQLINLAILAFSIAYFSLIPSVFVGRLSDEKRNDYNTSELTSTLFQQKEDIMQSVSDIQDPAGFSSALSKFPSITNITIKPGTSPDSIRRGIESALDQAIEQQLQSLKKRQTIQRNILNKTAISSVVGCAVAGSSLLMLTYKIYGWPIPFSSKNTSRPKSQSNVKSRDKRTHLAPQSSSHQEK
jgi:hypothetical protein